MKMKRILLSFYFSVISLIGFSQSLHHQMLASQGGTMVIPSGLVVLQSIGQMSPIGNVTVNGLQAQQGFQQWLKIPVLALPTNNQIIPTFYPNPFNNVINVKFLVVLEEDLTFTLYNIFGIPLYSKAFKSPQSIVTLNFGRVPPGNYILLLKGKNYSYSKTIIKL
jgi:hypothetical protein